MQEREIIHEFPWTQLLAWGRDNYSDSDDSDEDIHDDARPNSTVAQNADWGSQKYQHADIQT